ncbi:hypothetical protein M8C21_029768 [Ambrosia artemisiifolia]|uniref:Two-component response regulator-like APRR1 n=1 Tax=Ambrosia artemisiifolia TaxID=4212 RepID=A0AAD5G8C8_AMBAR|nr:hypothetical protein M8C21_029768 [Ambrosia artemisiifolia]
MCEMEPMGIRLGRGGGDSYGMTGDGFIDRSKVRILLCDNDSKGSGDVFTLLCKCSYQVISVKSPRQVIDALNAEGPNIDIILSEVDLPKAKGLKMLKCIMRKELQRIPIIMMSAQDEVPLVVKCLSLGAADYLVKPLRINELLNLWTHMWRRRRMLGLTEKKTMMNCEFDLVLSDHSDAKTTSTVFSDDTDEKSRKSANLEISLSIHNTNEINVILAPGPADEKRVSLSSDRSDLPETNDNQRGFSRQLTSSPKKCKLKIGQSSAFFTYVSTSKPTRNAPGVLASVDETTLLSRIHKESSLRGHVDGPPVNLFSQNIPEKVATCGEVPNNISFNPHSAYPYYPHGAMNQVMMPSSSPSMYHEHYPPHHVAGMTSFPYYPSVNMSIQPGQMPYPWSAYGSTPSNDAEGQSQTIDRREAALRKFRQKRKQRCFDKKIRYINRKKLAERRPRVRGQFVRKVNGIDVDLNGYPVSNDFDNDDDEEEEY